MKALPERYHGRVEQLLAELTERNRDNVTRTSSYLTLFALTREAQQEHPWLLMAHLVSRNAGEMMTGLRHRLEDERRGFSEAGLEQLFLFLERANFIIFYDAWWHVCMQLLGRDEQLQPPRTPTFIKTAYQRQRNQLEERALVLDLVINEQNLIEHHVVHHPSYKTALALIGFFEFVGADKPLRLGEVETGIRVGRFASLEHRIRTGQRLYDEHLCQQATRQALFTWATAHPHSGEAAQRGRRLTLRDAWPVEAVLRLDPKIHAPPAYDPRWS